MVQIPEQQALTPEQAFERLQIWFAMQQQLADLKTAEVLSRKSMATYYFPTPNEGTNRVDIGLGYDLKLEHKITRNVDEAALQNVTAADVAKLKLPMDELFVWKPQLSLTAYRALNDKQRAYVDALLDIDYGTPQLHIVPAVSAEAAAKAHAAQAANAPAYDINLGAEEATLPSQYFKDADGVWWQLDTDGERWDEVSNMATLEALEEQIAAPAAKPKRARKPRAAKAGGK